MDGFVIWLRRNVTFLTVTLGVCCFLEITFQLLEGTRPNFQFPWGHYKLALAVLGVLFLAVAGMTRLPAERGAAQAQAPLSPDSPSRPSERSRK